MRVKCTSGGCPWVSELGSLEKHLETCGFVLVLCTNGCNIRIMRDKHPLHCAKLCPLREYTCKHCKSKGTYKEMTGRHLDTCPNLEIPCPNDKCGNKIKRNQLTSHRVKCPYEAIDCPYKDVGCRHTFQRHAMEDHKANSYSHHLDLAMVQLKYLEHKATSCELSMVKLGQCDAGQKSTPCVIKMPGFHQLKTNKQLWYSPGFYIHSGGYKVCLCVYANGAGDGEGSHVSLFLCLMKGENDDALTWPIRYKCTFTLLNQLRDESHCSLALAHAGDGAVVTNSRVLGEKEFGIGQGYTKFIPHEQLGLREDILCQYLKDDCLYFRVQVDVLPAGKPWLMVTVP